MKNVIPEETPITITEHAYDRMKERLGWNKKAADRMAPKAFRKGIRHGETRGSLHRYLDSIWFSHQNATDMRIYGQAIFIFRGKTLITVYEMPQKYRKMQQSQRT